MKELKPIRLKESDYIKIEEKANRFFLDNLYYPISRLLDGKFENVYNGSSVIADAVLKNTIFIEGDKVYGQFNSKLTKEIRAIGGKYNKSGKYWTLASKNITPEIRLAMVSANVQLERLSNNIVNVLDTFANDLEKNLAQMSFNLEYDEVFNNVNEQIAKSGVAVMPQITKEAMGVLSSEYSENLKLYIKDFANDDILKLRQNVLENVYSGNRSTKLIKMLESQYSVTKSKAKFLARQETSLAMAKFRKGRYQDLGIQRYKWSTAKDVRVRDRHQHLDGKVFSYDNPPIVDDKGNRANPGEDFGCRCVDIPIVE